jgi:hypothetical protein
MPHGQTQAGVFGRTSRLGLRPLLLSKYPLVHNDEIADKMLSCSMGPESTANGSRFVVNKGQGVRQCVIRQLKFIRAYVGRKGECDASLALRPSAPDAQDQQQVTLENIPQNSKKFGSNRKTVLPMIYLSLFIYRSFHTSN